jgi:16S rRNA (adenine1518-N6/adenine1519-N6)-dimethyltransferase
MPHRQAGIDQLSRHSLYELGGCLPAQLRHQRLDAVAHAPGVADRGELVVKGHSHTQEGERIRPRQLLHELDHIELVPLLEGPYLAFGAETEAHLADGAAAILEDALGQLGRGSRRVHRTRADLARHAGIISVVAKKSLGQHFLTDASVVRDIVAALELKPGERVLEIGPGHGVLTQALVERGAEVAAIELDDELIPELQRLPIHVIHDDILRVDLGGVMGGEVSHPAPGARRPYKVAGNIPYYISSAILRHLLEAQPKPELVVLMLQKELAERVVAAPGGMSLLSVSVQVYGAARIVCQVPASAFRPRPKVDSAVLRIDVYPRPAVPMPDPEVFFAVVRAGFAERRKQMHNALQRNYKPAGAHTKASLDPQAVSAALRRSGVDPMRRAETLTLQEWAAVAEAVTELT